MSILDCICRGMSGTWLCPHHGYCHETMCWDESPRELITRLINERGELSAKIEFLRSKGLTVGTMQESGKDPYLAYAIEPGSELCDTETISKLVDAEVRADKYEAELDRCAAILQRAHPMGAVMGFGLLNVAQALEEVVDGASESALRELHAAIERSGLDISCCMDCGAPVVCIPDGLPMCEGCATTAVESGKGLPKLTDAEKGGDE